jgi:hypothetical protein
MSNQRTLIETDLFMAQMADLGYGRYVDEALEAITWAVSIAPEEYPIIPGTKDLRVAKSRWYEREGIIVPPLKVWFRILDDDRVELLAISQEETINDAENY